MIQKTIGSRTGRSGEHGRNARATHRITRSTSVLAVLLAAPWVLSIAACESRQGVEQSTVQPAYIDGLGALHFPNSGAAAAQEPFLRGVLLLHSFEYEAAAREFEQAEAADPDFALAYWGHAMTFNHPLWRQKDHDAAFRVLERLAPSTAERRAKAPTEREAMYLDALEALYADGTKTETDRAYMEAMKRLSEAYPDDHEARAFYALSILGTVDGRRDFATYMRAAATAQPVFDANPLHPGAAHYIIHSFDDPIHAPLGLPAALAYADIAPEAAHAQHMTSHVFLALGRWDDVVLANERARDVQDADRAERGEPANLCGHYSSWLQYGHLQRGEIEPASALLDACHERVTQDPSQGAVEENEWAYFVGMRARQIVDTEQWQLAERWTADVPGPDESQDDPSYARLSYELTNAYAALRAAPAAAVEPARELLERWSAVEKPKQSYQLLQLRGLLELAEGRTEEGLETLRAAATEAESLPYGFGPPDEVKPAFELLGEELAHGDLPAEALEAFRTAVARTPGRPLAEDGLSPSDGG